MNKKNKPRHPLKMKFNGYFDREMSCLRDAMVEFEKEHREEKRHNERLFKVIQNFRGKQFVKELVEEMKNTNYVNKFCLVKKPLGDYQGKNGLIEFWVDQGGGGISGDSFSGYMYVKLKKGLYLEMYYNC